MGKFKTVMRLKDGFIDELSEHLANDKVFMAKHGYILHDLEIKKPEVSIPIIETPTNDFLEQETELVKKGKKKQ